jgi:hypothetical protein
MTTTNPTEAQKFLWAGLARNLPNVSAAFGLVTNLSVSVGSVLLTATFDLENQDSNQQDITIQIIAGDRKEATRVISVPANTTKNVSIDFTTTGVQRGQTDITVKSGADSATTTVDLSPF